MPNTLVSRLSWDESGTAVRDAEGHVSFTAHTTTPPSEDVLPMLSEDAQDLGCIYLPIEHFLSRSFHFPLKHRHYLDSELLAQELVDTAGIEPDEWWLSWRSEKVQGGVAGLVFALPEHLKQAMQAQPSWQQTPLLLIDGWERLNDWLKQVDYVDASLAVVDADAEGVFFGFFHQGSWHGMRRLNADMHDDEAGSLIAQQVVWSLQAMGMNLIETQIIGRLTPALADCFPLAHNTYPATIEKTLSPRHMLNLMLPNPLNEQPQGAKAMKSHQCNVRHGQWKVQQGSYALKLWKRSLLMAASLCFLGLMLTITQNFQLEKQQLLMQDEMLAILHQTLPGEPAIDILAQLRRAVGDDATHTAQNDAQSTIQLQRISQVFEAQAWQMQEVKMDAAGVLLTGKIESLSALNKVRDLLAKKMDTEVNIADTDVSGDEVTFRIRWSW